MRKQQILLLKRDGLSDDDFVLKFLQDKFEIITENQIIDNKPIVVSLGGDGTHNKSVRKYSKYKLRHIGFHRGSDEFSEGFMLVPPMEKYLNEFLNNEFDNEEVRMLKIIPFDRDGNIISGSFYAFNDAYFKVKNPLGVMKVAIKINDKIFFDSMSCDGIIVCTASGSTAYSGAAGGELIPITSNNMAITGIAPAYKYRWRSSLLNSSEVVELKLLNTERREAVFSIDGALIKNVDKVIIKQSKEKKVRLIFPKSYDFRKKQLSIQIGNNNFS